MAFSQVNCFDADATTLRATVQCTAADTVQLEVDTSSAFNVAPRKGSIETADASKDYVVKVLVGGLQPNTAYFWRVLVNGVVQTPQTQIEGTGTSVVSLKTAPADGDLATTVKIAVGSCMLEGDHLVWNAINGLDPQLMVLLGDNTYTDQQINPTPDSQQDYYDAYNLLFDNTVFSEGRFQRCIGYRRATKSTNDDHDYDADLHTEFANRANLRAWGFKAWDERWPHDRTNWPKPPARKSGTPYEDGVFRVERFGMVDLFFLDSRLANQDWTTYERWPNDGPDNHVIAADSTRDEIHVVDNVPQLHITDKSLDAYEGWYVKLADTSIGRTVVRPPRSDLWRRVKGSYMNEDGDGVWLVLDKPLPLDFDPTVHQYLFMENASVLDATRGSNVPMLDGNQFHWLVDALNASDARWKIICSPLVMNETQTEDDNWRKFSAQCSEIRTLYQYLDNPDNVLVVSGDSHRHQLDDGTNGEFPEANSSPLDAAGSTGATGTWSHGRADRPTTNPDGSSNGFALLTITSASVQIDYYWSNSGTASAMGGITSLNIPYTEPTLEDYEMQTKRLTLTGVQSDAAVVTPGSGERLRIKRIAVTRPNTTSDLVVSRGNAADSTVLIHEESSNKAVREYERPYLILEPDEVLRFTGGVAAEDTTIVVEYASR